MRKAAFIISVLLVSLAVEMLVFEGAEANPYMYDQEEGKVSPLSDAKPPTITIHIPKNNTVNDKNNVFLNFTVTVVIPTLPELFYYYLELSEVYYKASWLPNSTYMDIAMVRNSIPRETTFSNDSYAKWNTFIAITGYTLAPSFSVNLTGVPDGSHYLEVFAGERGSREIYKSASPMTIHYGRYELFSSARVYFTVDTTPPSISDLSLINETYNYSDVPLNFNVNETSQIFYSIDNQANMTVTGNTTLSRLSDGSHYLIVYANDSVGNVGKSEIAYFRVSTKPLTSPSQSPSPSTQQQTLYPSEDQQAENFLLTLSLIVISLAAAIITVAVYFRRKVMKRE